MYFLSGYMKFELLQYSSADFTFGVLNLEPLEVVATLGNFSGWSFRDLN